MTTATHQHATPAGHAGAPGGPSGNGAATDAAATEAAGAATPGAVLGAGTGAAVVEAIAGFDREAELAAGANPARVRAWEKLKRVYVTAKSHPKQQRIAVEMIASASVHPDKLILIENLIAHIGNESEKWRLRHRLLEVRGGYEVLRRQAKKLVPEKEETPWKNGVSFSASRNGKRKMTAIDDEDRLAALESFFSQDLDPDEPIAEQRLDAFRKFMFGDSQGAEASESPGKVPTRVPRPIVVVGLPDYVNVLEGSGDDVVLGLSDGTTMTGAEFLNLNHAGPLEVGLFHPEVGPVNLYRGERFANAKQRVLAKAATPMCPHPGCKTAADLCEMHHMYAWKHGGHTNVDNLVPQCRYHNRINDDEWFMKRRRHARLGGRLWPWVEPVGGRPTWMSPNGYAADNEFNRFGAMTVLFGPRPPDR